MMNMMQMVQKAQKMQKRIKEAQTELEHAQITSEGANGAVVVTLNGQGKFMSIKLKKEAINPENPESIDDDTLETLEDLLTETLKNASEKAAIRMNNTMKEITGGLSIPGLF